jgi:hypothetical protein
MRHNVFALFGTVAALLTVTVALTLSRTAPVADGVGNLRCYAGAVETPCDQPPLIKTRAARLD